MKPLKRMMIGLAASAVVMSAQAADQVELEGASVGIWTMTLMRRSSWQGRKIFP